MKTKMMMLCLALVSWGAFAQHDHAKDGGHDKMKMDKKGMRSEYGHIQGHQLG